MPRCREVKSSQVKSSQEEGEELLDARVGDGSPNTSITAVAIWVVVWVRVGWVVVRIAMTVNSSAS